MKGIIHLSKETALAPTALSSEVWCSKTAIERAAMVRDNLAVADVVNTTPGGTISLRMKFELSAADRGSFLRILERHFKQVIDPACRILLEPLVDKNKLRQWRGVTVKDETH